MKPLSDAARAAPQDGIKSAQTSPPVDRGSFAQYADDVTDTPAAVWFPAKHLRIDFDRAVPLGRGVKTGG